MSRKSKKVKKQAETINYPQVYSPQPPMGGYDAQGMGYAPNPMFVYEPVPIKKRNRQIIPFLMLIFSIIIIAAGVGAYFMCDAVLTDDMKNELKIEERYNQAVEQLPQGTEIPDFVTMAEIVKVAFAMAAMVAVGGVLGLIIEIWYLIAMCHVSQEINLIASDYDHKTTMFYCMAVFFTIITFGLFGIVYYNNLSARVGMELKRRSIKYKFDEGTYWGWCIIGSLLFGLGPIIYLFKFFKAMKKLTADYNIYG